LRAGVGGHPWFAAARIDDSGRFPEALADGPAGLPCVCSRQYALENRLSHALPISPDRTLFAPRRTEPAPARDLASWCEDKPPALALRAEPTPAALRFEGFGYAYPGADRWVLRGASLEIPAGECHCLSGPTGSGKTTLALAARGLLEAVRCEGRVEVAGGSQANVGLVLENPDVQLLTDTVAAEVAFGLENRCVPAQAMPSKVTAALAAVGLAKPLDFPTAHLSMGQKYRLLIAAQWVLDPGVLILDEPVAQLDPDGLVSLAAIIEELKRRGVAVLLCEHRPEPLARVVDRYWQLTCDGTIQAGCAAQETAKSAQAPREAIVQRRSTAAARVETPRQRGLQGQGGALVLRTRGLCLDPADATPAWTEASLAIGAGERVALCARNGAGKTSLLRCLAGFIAPAAGEVRVCGERPSPKRLRGLVGYLAQNPERQLFETTVFDEVAFPLRRLGISSGDAGGKVERMLARCGIGDLAASSPHRLSYGHRRLVALASILVAEPRLLLLDDPFAGLDADRAATVAGVLIEVSERHATAVLWTSHDGCTARQWAHATWVVEGGTLAAA